MPSSISVVSVVRYLTAPKVRSVLSGVRFDDYALAVDDFDTSNKSDSPIIEIDPRGLVPTQDDVEEDHVLRLAKVPSVELPPIKVVAVLGQLRALPT